MKHDASIKTPHLALIFTEDKNGGGHVTKTKQLQTEEYPKATQQSTALRLLGERTRMSFLAGTSSAPLTLFLMMLFLSLSLSLSLILCLCA